MGRRGRVRRADVEALFTAPETKFTLQWPQASLHTQWPGRPGAGVAGRPAFEQFYASQVASIPDVERLYSATRAAARDMLDKVGPAILVVHSQAGPLGWMIAQDNPGMVKAIVAVEPTGAANLADKEPGLACGITPSCLHFEPAASGPDDLRLVREEREGPDLSSCWLGRIHIQRSQSMTAAR